MVLLLWALVRAADPIMHVGLLETQLPSNCKLLFSTRPARLHRLTMNMSGGANWLIMALLFCLELFVFSFKQARWDPMMIQPARLTLSLNYAGIIAELKVHL